MERALATYRNGRVELDNPPNWPEGTRLEVAPAVRKLGLDESQWPETPEEKAEWLGWFRSLEPLDMTAEELAEFEAERRAVKDAQKELLLEEWQQERPA